MFIRFLFISSLFFFSSSALAIYNLQTNKGGNPKNVASKHWLLVSQGCQSCTEVLTKLSAFCSGKKPSPDRIGFFATGSSPQKLLKKLSDFKGDYEIFSGSPNEFYQSYKISGSPSLKIKGKSKSLIGSEKILKYLKKDSEFCKA